MPSLSDRQGSINRTKQREELSWSDPAILLRSDRNNGKPILEALRTARIPHFGSEARLRKLDLPELSYRTNQRPSRRRLIDSSVPDRPFRTIGEIVEVRKTQH